MLDSTRRFSNRVDNYVRYRPGYPDRLLEVLREVCGLAPGDAVADVGSGTGKLTEVLLRGGNTVYAVEPNADMRAAGERLLGGHENFISVCGTAEDTTLSPQSVHLVTAGQAFHWFDPLPSGREFHRILKDPGWVALIWNDRDEESTPFLHAYENLLQEHATDYANSRQADSDEARALAFLGGACEPSVRTLSNYQELDLEGLRGRLLSSSYAPLAGQPGHDAMMRRLDEIFAEYQSGGRVRFEYTTRLFCGMLR